MATLKDVAKLAGTSPTTVSIIMNGKAKTRAISSATVEKVMQAVRELNYQPSISARMLRSTDAASFHVGLFWSSDERSLFMSRFLAGLQEKAELLRNDNIDLVIHPYRLGELDQEEALYRMNSFNAAIIANLSEKDYTYLHENPCPIPLVLLNRRSSLYHSVFINDEELGHTAARHLYERGVRSAAVLTLPQNYHSMRKSRQGFQSECEKLGITVRAEHVLECGISIREGAKAAEKLLADTADSFLPDAVFCTSDATAVGLMRVLNKKGIRVPEELQVIAFNQGPTDTTMYYTPSITILDIPFETMACHIMDIIHRISQRSQDGVATEEIESILYHRESTLP